MRASISRLGEDGIEVLNLVVPKPEIPEDIAHNYKQVKVQWTEQLVANQTQKTEEIRKKTELVKAVADAERQKAVLEIKIQEQRIKVRISVHCPQLSTKTSPIYRLWLTLSGRRPC